MRRFLLALLALACAAGAKTFTLEQVLSAPFPSELIASPDGNRVAWMLNERGARNVWVASAPDWKGVRATSYTADDGQDVGQLQWTPDSRSVVYVHGGDLEFLGRPDPNPAMNPAGVEQAVWLVTPGQAPRKIAVGHSPAVSPKGDRIVFLLGGQVWTAPLTEPAAPAMLIHARTGATASELVWSPDGAKVAFVSDRTNHSFIAIYDFTAKSLEYLDPSTDRDRNPVWSPDGRQIAFIRNLTGGSAGRGAHRTGEPWAIRVASVADGAGRQIWKAEPGPGSVFHPMVSEQQLYWGAGDRILFPVGARRLAAPLLRSGRRRRGHAADAGQLRSGARCLLARRQGSRLLLQPGRHRPPAHLARLHRSRTAHALSPEAKNWSGRP